MESNVPVYFTQAREALEQAADALSTDSSLEPNEIARVHAAATTGVGFAILAAVQELARQR